MTRYQNGRAPLSDLVKLGDKHYLPAGTCARWQEMQRLAWEKYGVWLVITPGWNGYRPLDIQVQYRAELGIYAAVPGTSSHGLTYQGRDCAAIDVNNWQALAPGNQSLAWARFVALCRLVGFTVDFVTPQELWHIGDFDPFMIPAFAAVTINPATTARPTEDDMYDDKAKEAAANRHTEALREISYLRPIKLYALVDENGAGGWVWVGPSGRFWAVPNGAYVAMVEAQKLSQASPIRALQKDEFKFLTEQLLGGLVPDGKNEYNPEAQLDKILSLDQATVDRIVAGIQAAPVVLTQAQLDAITAAAARGAASGGEDGARKALQDLTFVVTAS